MSGDVLTIAGLRLSRGAREILKGVYLTARRGEIVALMGLSGGGKTTVLRSIAALEPFDEGSIDVDGFRLAPGPLSRESRLAPLRRKVALVFQQHGLFEHLDALHNVTLAPVHVLGTPREEAEEKAIALLSALGVSHRTGALPRQLSGGEAQRVAIARALAVGPRSS
ncbi:MAG: amino acid ABC transporter ATP-binding protein [Holophagales bacterium]|nr:amino acid ABC transporter ATP-binding protein [Holophagales bacterium]